MRRALIALTTVAAVCLGVSYAARHLLHARKSANEAASVGALRAIATSQSQFREGDKESDGNLDYGALNELSNVTLTDSVLGRGSRQGDFFRTANSDRSSEFLWFALANGQASSGDRYFETNAAGVIFYTTSGNLLMDTATCTLPVSGFTPVGKGSGDANSGDATPDASKPARSANAKVSPARRLVTRDTRPKPPELLVRSGSQQEPLPLEAMKIAAVLGATRARVLVDCAFKNTQSTVLEGTFTIALPEGASPCYLETFQGEGVRGELLDLASLVAPATDPVRLLDTGFSVASSWQSGEQAIDWGVARTARVVEPTKGKIVYEQVTRRRVDPALMEWSGSQHFSTRVFPIAAGARKRVVFAYDVTPREDSGRATVVLPVPDPEPPALRVEVAADGRAYSDAATIDARGETALAGGVFLRGVVTTKSATSGSCILAARPRTRDSYGTSGVRIRAGMGSGNGVPGNLVHARLAPTVKATAEHATGDAVFFLDTSLSQRTQLAPSCARLLRAILERDATLERFRVIAFDVRARELTAGWTKNAPASRESVLAGVEKIWLEGATDVGAALTLGDQTIAAGEHPTCFLLSDAEVTWGVDEPRELERAFPRLFGERWIAYQVGEAPVNRPLLDRLTRAGGRVVTVATPGEVEAAALAHRVSPVRLTSVHVDGVAASDLVVAGAPRALFPGQVLEVGFRTTSEKVSGAALVVESDGGVESFSLADTVPGDALAARAWAELATSSLLDLGDEDADGVALALSQRFALVNRAASLLILETDSEYLIQGFEKEKLDLAEIARLAQERGRARPAGAPDLTLLGPTVKAFLERIRARRAPAWVHSVEVGDAKGALAPPVWPERLDSTAVYREATRRQGLGRSSEALRVLSSIVEENPRDAQALRLAGYTLLSWGLFEDAATLFARTRVLRPFEPQTWLTEALALEAQGLVGEAAVRYEVVLAGRFDARTEGYAKTTARRLYSRLLARIGSDATARAVDFSADPMPTRDQVFEAVLFWNLDDTDIDLHTIEASGNEVFYGSPQSASGGRLHWDNTAGLGPEVYTHPTSVPQLEAVNYYGTRSVSGVVPAATLVVSFVKGESPEANATVLEGQKERVVVWRAPSR